MSSSTDHKCQRCGSSFQGQVCPFCTITGLDVNALLASEGLSLSNDIDAAPVVLVDVVSNRPFPVAMPICRIGRDISNDIVLAGDKSLSRFHFQITCLENEYYVEDAGSRNGTFLNGSPVTAPRKILNGDILSAGMSRYRFVIKAEEEGKPTGESVPAASANTPPTPPNPVEATKPTEAVSKPGSAADPLAKIMQEGQSLITNKGEDADLDSLFDSKGNGNDRAETTGLMVAPTPPTAESELDDLFKEHLNDDKSQVNSGTGAPAADAEEVKAAPEPAKAASKPASTERQDDFAPPTAGDSEKQWPNWCNEYSFVEVTGYKQEITDLQAQVRQAQERIRVLENLVRDSEEIKNDLLASRNGDLIQACSRAMVALGWTVEPNGNSSNELVLRAGAKAEALLKIVSTDSEPPPADLANLVGSQSTYWVEHKVEPKAILLIAQVKDGPPTDRRDCSAEFSEYAAKKNVCVMSTLQLLAMFRDVNFGNSKSEDIRHAILGTSGQLSGYDIELSKPQAVAT